jgi:hypothetical protein
LAFNPLRENQRPALLLSNGVVYIAFGAHSDVSPYHGWLLGYDASTLSQVFVFNSSPNDDGGGIWQANGGPAADASGNIFIATGNGGFDANTGSGKDYGDSYIKIQPGGAVLDYFTPKDQANLSTSNFDLGAAGVMLLPDQSGSHPHLLVSAGKNRTMYLVDRDSMGHYNANSDNVVQSLSNIFPTVPGNYSAPVYFNNRVYFGSVTDTVTAFAFSGGLLSTSATSRSPEVYDYPGATLAVSANGSTNGILWAIQRNGSCTAPPCGSSAYGTLRAYDPSNLAIEFYNSDQTPGRDMLDYPAKFSVPLVANGQVFIGSTSKLTVYGLLQR